MKSWREEMSFLWRSVPFPNSRAPGSAELEITLKETSGVPPGGIPAEAKFAHIAAGYCEEPKGAQGIQEKVNQYSEKSVKVVRDYIKYFRRIYIKSG